VWASTNDSAFAATPVTDNKGNTYTAIDSLTTDATFGIIGQMFFCQNGVGGAGHTATVHNSSHWSDRKEVDEQLNEDFWTHAKAISGRSEDE